MFESGIKSKWGFIALKNQSLCSHADRSMRLRYLEELNAMTARLTGTFSFFEAFPIRSVMWTPTH